MAKPFITIRRATLLSLAALAAIVAAVVFMAYLEQRWTILFAVKEAEEPWQLPDGAEEVSFDSADGVRLFGWYFDARAPRNGITVLLMHGNIGVLPLYAADAQYMRQRGFNVLLFNYRGFGRSDGATAGEATLDRDADAALRYLTGERGLGPHSIALVGGSFGASIAAKLAARSPCRAVALVSGIASAQRTMKHARPWVPAAVFAFLQSPLDTVRAIRRARCPVLVVHGANDDLVPLSDAREVYAAAPSPKRLVIVPDSGHGFSGVDHAAFLEPMTSFFANPQ